MAGSLRRSLRNLEPWKLEKAPVSTYPNSPNAPSPFLPLFASVEEVKWLQTALVSCTRDQIAFELVLNWSMLALPSLALLSSLQVHQESCQLRNGFLLVSDARSAFWEFGRRWRLRRESQLQIRGCSIHGCWGKLQELADGEKGCDVECTKKI